MVIESGTQFVSTQKMCNTGKNFIETGHLLREKTKQIWSSKVINILSHKQSSLYIQNKSQTMRVRDSRDNSGLYNWQKPTAEVWGSATRQ